jgi:hypothetical protein
VRYRFGYGAIAALFTGASRTEYYALPPERRGFLQLHSLRTRMHPLVILGALIRAEQTGNGYWDGAEFRVIDDWNKK